MNGVYPSGTGPDSNHVFALLSDYTDSLDSLPLDLTRNFSDLRELDAVLRTSINALTAKITSLTALLQDPNASPASRLFLLREIADAASHLKMGGEDKIRVAGIAAENLAGHQTHIHSVLKTISLVAPPAQHCPNGSDFDPASHTRRTTFPHVAPAREHASAPSPHKRRRPDGRTVNGSTSYGATNGRAPPKRKVPVAAARQLSPPESLRSFGTGAGYSGHHTNGFSENGYGHHNGRHHDDDDGTDDEAGGNHTSNARNKKPARRTNNGNTPTGANNPHMSTNSREGTSSLLDVVMLRPEGSDGDDEGEGDMSHPMGSGPVADEQVYCTCKRVSFGEMIACDNTECPFEWFHLSCVGITKPSPMEKWYCERCREGVAQDANINTTVNGAKSGRGGRGRGKGTGGVKRGRSVK